MPLTLTLTASSSLPIEVESLSPLTLRNRRSEEIGRIPLTLGNSQVECGELFRISGSADDDNTLIFAGPCQALQGVGSQLTTGIIHVAGSAGRHLGAGMKGGQILVAGDTGDWTGAEMHGGRIDIRGNAGSQLGCVYRGARKGMTGGEILVHGSAGHEIGRGMRRGLIAVGKAAGDAVGLDMIAGTILVFGPGGSHHGAGMRRGTIAFLDAGATPPMLPSFREATVGQAHFLQLYFRHLRAAQFPVAEELTGMRLRTFRGDLLELGLGEILCAAG